MYLTDTSVRLLCLVLLVLLLAPLKTNAQTEQISECREGSGRDIALDVQIPTRTAVAGATYTFDLQLTNTTKSTLLNVLPHVALVAATKHNRGGTYFTTTAQAQGSPIRTLPPGEPVVVQMEWQVPVNAPSGRYIAVPSITQDIGYWYGGAGIARGIHAETSEIEVRSNLDVAPLFAADSIVIEQTQAASTSTERTINVRALVQNPLSLGIELPIRVTAYAENPFNTDTKSTEIARELFVLPQTGEREISLESIVLPSDAAFIELTMDWRDVSYRTLLPVTDAEVDSTPTLAQYWLETPEEGSERIGLCLDTLSEDTYADFDVHVSHRALEIFSMQGIASTSEPVRVPALFFGAVPRDGLVSISLRNPDTLEQFTLGEFALSCDAIAREGCADTPVTEISFFAQLKFFYAQHTERILAVGLGAFAIAILALYLFLRREDE